MKQFFLAALTLANVAHARATAELNAVDARRLEAYQVARDDRRDQNYARVVSRQIETAIKDINASQSRINEMCKKPKLDDAVISLCHANYGVLISQNVTLTQQLELALGSKEYKTAIVAPMNQTVKLDDLVHRGLGLMREALPKMYAWKRFFGLKMAGVEFRKEMAKLDGEIAEGRLQIQCNFAEPNNGRQFSSAILSRADASMFSDPYLAIRADLMARETQMRVAYAIGVCPAKNQAGLKALDTEIQEFLAQALSGAKMDALATAACKKLKLSAPYDLRDACARHLYTPAVFYSLHMATNGGVGK